MRPWVRRPRTRSASVVESVVGGYYGHLSGTLAVTRVRVERQMNIALSMALTFGSNPCALGSGCLEQSNIGE